MSDITDWLDRNTARQTWEPNGPPRRQRGAQLGHLERELHDTVLQDLLCIGMGLEGLKQRHLDEQTEREVAHLHEIASRAYERLRELISGESTDTAPPRSMRDVLTACVRSFNLKFGANVQLQLNDTTLSPMVSGDVARQADLIVREALFNAWRHGRARTIKVVLSETADIIWVKVIDDGRGFDPTVRRPGHYGMRTMRDRAEAIGARLGISSAPGKGTCVNLYLPSHHSTVYNAQEASHGHSFAGR